MQTNLASELQIKTSHYLITGFSIVVGLSWNDFIRRCIENYFPSIGDALYMKLVYCLLITLALIVFIKVLPSTDNELPKLVKKTLAAAEAYRNRNFQN